MPHSCDRDEWGMRQMKMMMLIITMAPYGQVFMWISSYSNYMRQILLLFLFAGEEIVTLFTILNERSHSYETVQPESRHCKSESKGQIFN